MSIRNDAAIVEDGKHKRGVSESAKVGRGTSITNNQELWKRGEKERNVQDVMT